MFQTNDSSGYNARQTERLYQNIKAGDTTGVKALLGMGCNPNAQTTCSIKLPNGEVTEGETSPLYEAVLAGNAEIVKILLEGGADPLASCTNILDIYSPAPSRSHMAYSSAREADKEIGNWMKNPKIPYLINHMVAHKAISLGHLDCLKEIQEAAGANAQKIFEKGKTSAAPYGVLDLAYAHPTTFQHCLSSGSDMFRDCSLTESQMDLLESPVSKLTAWKECLTNTVKNVLGIKVPERHLAPCQITSFSEVEGNLLLIPGNSNLSMVLHAGGNDHRLVPQPGLAGNLKGRELGKARAAITPLGLQLIRLEVDGMVVDAYQKDGRYTIPLEPIEKGVATQRV